jgi:putative phosphoesterase
MRLGLIGDIHANHYALAVVLAAATAFEVEKLLITGDLVGYYFDPLEVLKLLEPWPKHAVRGNHEDMLSFARSDPSFLHKVNNRYGLGLHTAIEQLSGLQLDKLCALPHPRVIEIEKYKILLCHGSPWSIEEYIYPDADMNLLKRCSDTGFDVIVHGHTHYPAKHVVGKTLIVNPGSVGQPRNRQPGAHWAIFDTTTGDLEFRCEPYSAAQLIKECAQKNPELPYLAEMLIRT